MKQLICLVVVSLSFALSITADGAQRKRVDAKRLKKKYWTSKKYKTGVVQGRTFYKENRLKFGLEHMILLNDKYSETDGFANVRGEVSYFINERMSVGVYYENLDLSDNTALREMAEFNGGAFKLAHVKATSFYGASFDFVPIYSKLSWMNKKIIYLDFMISPKVGMATYKQQTDDNSGAEETVISAGLDLSTNIFINKNFSVNLAYRTRMYQAEVIDFTTKQVVEDAKFNFHNFFTLGLNYYF